MSDAVEPAKPPIQVSCECGFSFKVKAKAAGRIVKCPKCKVPIRIAAPEAIPSEPDPSEFASESSLDPFGELDVPEVTKSASITGFDDVVPAAPATISTGASSPIKRNVPNPRRYRALEVVAVVYRVLAIGVVAIWAIGSLIFGLGVIGLSSVGTSATATLPPGVSADADIFDESLTEAQREALIEYQFQSKAPAASKGLAILGFIPWFGMTVLAAIVATALWAVAEVIGLAIDVQSNTFDTAYG